MNRVINDDPRNNGIKVSVHYSWYVNPSVLVYNLKSVSSDKSPADVFRAFLQFAEEVSDKNFKEVILAFRGKPKFKMDGDYFQEIGKEYSWQNPIYTVRTFPEHLTKPDGSRAYDVWTGGLLGVLGKQMDDQNDFHRKWYIDDMLSDY